jgi:hypothetical protein
LNKFYNKYVELDHCFQKAYKNADAKPVDDGIL